METMQRRSWYLVVRNDPAKQRSNETKQRRLETKQRRATRRSNGAAIQRSNEQRRSGKRIRHTTRATQGQGERGNTEGENATARWGRGAGEILVRQRARLMASVRLTIAPEGAWINS